MEMSGRVRRCRCRPHLWETYRIIETNFIRVSGDVLLRLVLFRYYIVNEIDFGAVGSYEDGFTLGRGDGIPPNVNPVESPGEIDFMIAVAPAVGFDRVTLDPHPIPAAVVRWAKFYPGAVIVHHPVAANDVIGVPLPDRYARLSVLVDMIALTARVGGTQTIEDSISPVSLDVVAGEDVAHRATSRLVLPRYSPSPITIIFFSCFGF